MISIERMYSSSRFRILQFRYRLTMPPGCATRCALLVAQEKLRPHAPDKEEQA